MLRPRRIATHADATNRNATNNRMQQITRDLKPVAHGLGSILR